MKRGRGGRQLHCNQANRKQEVCKRAGCCVWPGSAAVTVQSKQHQSARTTTSKCQPSENSMHVYTIKVLLTLSGGSVFGVRPCCLHLRLGVSFAERDADGRAPPMEARRH